MQRLVLVRYTTKPECTEENMRLSRAVFPELEAAAPDGIGYAVFRNGNDFVHLLVNTTAADSSVVIDQPAFRTYLRDIGARCVAPPDRIRLDLTLLDAYGMAGAPVPA